MHCVYEGNGLTQEHGLRILNLEFFSRKSLHHFLLEIRIKSDPCVSRKADQIQRQCSLFSVANTAIKGDFETIALAPNKGLLIQEGNSNSLLLQ